MDLQETEHLKIHVATKLLVFKLLPNVSKKKKKKKREGGGSNLIPKHPDSTNQIGIDLWLGTSLNCYINLIKK